MMYFCPRCRSRVFKPSAVTLDIDAPVLDMEGGR